MFFQLDNHHLSLMDRSFISTMSHTYCNHEMLSSIPIYNFFQICHPQISKFHIFIFIYVPHRNQIHKYEIFLLITVWLSQHWSFLWDLLMLPYPRPFFLQLHLHIAKQVVSYHAHYIFQTVHTKSQIIFIYSMIQWKRKYHSLHMQNFSVLNFSKCNSNIK